MAVRATTGTAVERNRLRRRIRAIFNAHGPRGSDVVVAATRDAAGKNFQELKEILSTALDRAGAVR
jgi:ribonuclease P protein component